MVEIASLESETAKLLRNSQRRRKERKVLSPLLIRWQRPSVSQKAGIINRKGRALCASAASSPSYLFYAVS